MRQVAVPHTADTSTVTDTLRIVPSAGFAVATADSNCRAASRGSVLATSSPSLTTAILRPVSDASSST